MPSHIHEISDPLDPPPPGPDPISSVPANPQQPTSNTRSEPALSHPPTTANASSPDPSSIKETINVGTRKSKLAIIQADTVVEALKTQWPDKEFKVHAMSTMGDKNQITALHEFGAKSLWTHELEALLIGGQLDLIVHSLKGERTSASPFSCD